MSNFSMLVGVILVIIGIYGNWKQGFVLGVLLLAIGAAVGMLRMIASEEEDEGDVGPAPLKSGGASSWAGFRKDALPGAVRRLAARFFRAPEPDDGKSHPEAEEFARAVESDDMETALRLLRVVCPRSIRLEHVEKLRRYVIDRRMYWELPMLDGVWNTIRCGCPHAGKSGGASSWAGFRKDALLGAVWRLAARFFRASEPDDGKFHSTAEDFARAVESDDMKTAIRLLEVVRLRDIRAEHLEKLRRYAADRRMYRELAILDGVRHAASLLGVFRPGKRHAGAGDVRPSGAGVSLPDESGPLQEKRPLWLDYSSPEHMLAAASRGDRHTVNTCLDFGVDINSRDSGGNTALMLAAAAGRYATVRHLLIHGYSIYTRRDSEASARIGEEIARRPAASGLGLSSGSGISLRNNDGDSALDLARRNGHDEVAWLLEEYGAESGLSLPERFAQAVESGDMAMALKLFKMVCDRDIRPEHAEKLHAYAREKGLLLECRTVGRAALAGASGSGADDSGKGASPSGLRGLVSGLLDVFLPWRRKQEKAGEEAAPAAVSLPPEKREPSWKRFCSPQCLFDAAAEGDRYTVNTCLDFGVDVNARDGQGRTALMIAAAAGHSATVRHLLVHGYSIYARRGDEDSARIAEEISRRPAASELGLSAGSGVNLRDESGSTALGLAKRNGHAETAALLEEYGAVE